MFNKNKEAWILESSSGRNKELLQKWEIYFFEDTIKHQKIEFFLGRLKIDNINSLNDIFPIHHHNKVSFREVYEALKTIKKGEIEELVHELRKKDINIANTTLYKSLYIGRYICYFIIYIIKISKTV